MKRSRCYLLRFAAAVLLVGVLIGPGMASAGEGKDDKAPEKQATDVTKAGTEQKGAPPAPQPPLPPGFTQLLGAFGAFGAFLLLLSILPEKITDVVKAGLRVDKKDTVSELFGWAGYDKVMAETSVEKLKEAYQVLYDTVEENVGRWRNKTEVAKKLREGLIDPGGSLTLGELQRNIIRLDLRMVDMEGRRVTLLRLLSMGIGIGLALLLQVNAFHLLLPVIRQEKPAFLEQQKQKDQSAPPGPVSSQGKPNPQGQERATEGPEKKGTTSPDTGLKGLADIFGGKWVVDVLGGWVQTSPKHPLHQCGNKATVLRTVCLYAV